MAGYGLGPYGSGPYGGSGGSFTPPVTPTPSGVIPWVPTDDGVQDASKWFVDGTSTAPGPAIYSNTIIIPVGTVATSLSQFPVRVRLSTLSTDWKLGLVDYGPQTLRVRDQNGDDVPFDLVWSDVFGGDGDLFFKAPTIYHAQDTYFTVDLVSGETAPAFTDPIGRNAVWSDYDAVFLDGYAVNRNGNGNDLTGYTINDTLTKWFNFTGASAPIATVPSRATWTIGGTFRTDVTSASGLVSYSSSATYSTANREGFVLQSGTTPGIWNSTNLYLYHGTPTYVNGSQERFNFQHDASTRKIYRNGAKKDQTLTAVRPAAPGDRLVVGASDLNVATPIEPYTGALNRVYLRNGILSDTWLTAETRSWEEPESFYSVSEDAPPAPIPPDHVWWDGSNYQPALLNGWWDGSTLQPVTILGWWDGAAIQPMNPAD